MMKDDDEEVKMAPEMGDQPVEVEVEIEEDDEKVVPIEQPPVQAAPVLSVVERLDNFEKILGIIAGKNIEAFDYIGKQLGNLMVDVQKLKLAGTKKQQKLVYPVQQPYRGSQDMRLVPKS